jgi:hypothetical protein
MMPEGRAFILGYMCKQANLKTSIARAYAAPKSAVKLPGLRTEQKLDKFTKKYLSRDNINRADVLMAKNRARGYAKEVPERASNEARDMKLEKIWLKAHANNLKGLAARTAVVTPPAYYGAQKIEEKLNKKGDK